MRRIYKYQLVRYFLGERSDEFINVGVIVKDENNTKIKLLAQEDRNKLDNCSFVEKRHLLRFLESLEKNGINRWYQNYIKFSQEKSYESEKNMDKLLEWLYETKVSYKFKKRSEKIKQLEDEIEKQNLHIQQLSIISKSILDIIKYIGTKNYVTRY